jgi:type VI secretion system secreted protein VgrG
MAYIRTAGRRGSRLASALLVVALLLGGWGSAARGESPSRSLRPAAALAFPGERQALESPELRASFPRLGNNFQVLAPSTRQYNCIAWSLGDTHNWVWPGQRLADFDALYGKHGYTREPGLNLAVEPGKRKLVLYATLNPDATIKAATHAAVQEPDGSWTSKLGAMALIHHATLGALRGPVYGTPVAVYVRPAN